MEPLKPLKPLEPLKPLKPQQKNPGSKSGACIKE
jgi:hypothetical protein